jgi:hypothetical protein
MFGTLMFGTLMFGTLMFGAVTVRTGLVSQRFTCWEYPSARSRPASYPGRGRSGGL